jgi:hypothetical protein
MILALAFLVLIFLLVLIFSSVAEPRILNYLRGLNDHSSARTVILSGICLARSTRQMESKDPCTVFGGRGPECDADRATRENSMRHLQPRRI